MKRIKLTQDKYALVDDKDFEWLSQFKWFLIKNRYAGTRILGKITYMHRFILSTPNGLETDHVNNNGLDNRRLNLRIATNEQNHFNHKIISTNTSGYIGISKTRNNRWHVSISFKGKTLHFGNYINILEAAIVRNQAALKYHGEFASLNKIGGIY